MLQRFRTHVPLLVTALIAGTVVAVGPTVAQAAYDAVNSDKVDGLHAVKAGATTRQRKGKLVATSPRSGRLPNNIIKTAPNADKVDGVNSSVLLDRDTRDEVDAMPASRLLGFGIVGSTGVLDDQSYFPGGTSSRVGTGVYLVTLPGYGPGCQRPFPVVAVSPQFSVGEAASGFGSMNCGTGDVSLQVNTTNSAGTATDKTFAFTFFAGGNPAAVPVPSARQGAAPDVCELTEAGVRCR